ncbi:MAG: NAD(P)-dependent oxidoreductase, partial [Halodesulfurarchaeum sp.]|nr:NAD(P)-dependent oxidoreductase [Halodesulfurarchaeum sp.]
MSILVTGATGFVGGYLVTDLLEHDYDVRALTRDREAGQERLDS